MELVDILAGLAAVLALCVNVLAVLLYRRLDKRLTTELRNLAGQVSASVEAGPKLNEVRDYYEFANAEFQKLLNEAHRDGDRQKQERFRKLIDRLAALKSRTLDKTAKLLDPDAQGGGRSSRRRRRRPRRPGKQNAKGGDNKDTSGSGNKK